MTNRKYPEGVPTSLSPEALDQLAELVIAKLTERSKGKPAFQAGCCGFKSCLPLHKTFGLLNFTHCFVFPLGFLKSSADSQI